MGSHPAGIRTEVDMWETMFDMVETEGFDYAIREFTNEVCAIDTTMRSLVDDYMASREAIRNYLEVHAQQVGRELAD